jgi:hypothetical protein
MGVVRQPMQADPLAVWARAPLALGPYPLALGAGSARTSIIAQCRRFAAGRTHHHGRPLRAASFIPTYSPSEVSHVRVQRQVL